MESRPRGWSLDNESKDSSSARWGAGTRLGNDSEMYGIVIAADADRFRRSAASSTIHTVRPSVAVATATASRCVRGRRAPAARCACVSRRRARGRHHRAADEGLRRAGRAPGRSRSARRRSYLTRSACGRSAATTRRGTRHGEGEQAVRRTRGPPAGCQRRDHGRVVAKVSVENEPDPARAPLESFPASVFVGPRDLAEGRDQGCWENR